MTQAGIWSNCLACSLQVVQLYFSITLSCLTICKVLIFKHASLIATVSSRKEVSTVMYRDGGHSFCHKKVQVTDLQYHNNNQLAQKKLFLSSVTQLPTVLVHWNATSDMTGSVTSQNLWAAILPHWSIDCEGQLSYISQLLFIQIHEPHYFAVSIVSSEEQLSGSYKLCSIMACRITLISEKLTLLRQS